MNRFLLTSSVLLGTVALGATGVAVHAATFAAVPDDGPRISAVGLTAAAAAEPGDDRTPEALPVQPLAAPTPKATRSVPVPTRRANDTTTKRAGQDDPASHDARDDRAATRSSKD